MGSPQLLSAWGLLSPYPDASLCKGSEVVQLGANANIWKSSVYTLEPNRIATTVRANSRRIVQIKFKAQVHNSTPCLATLHGGIPWGGQLSTHSPTAKEGCPCLTCTASPLHAQTYKSIAR